MKLYYSPGACSLAPHIVSLEAGLGLTLHKVDTSAHTTADGADFHLINTKGQVPVLELDDGSRLTEGPVLTQFIADHAKAVTLMPAAGTLARYRVMEWQNYITSELHKSFTPLFHGWVDGPSKQTLVGVLEKNWPGSTASWPPRPTSPARPSRPPTHTCTRCCAGLRSSPSTSSVTRTWRASWRPWSSGPPCAPR